MDPTSERDYPGIGDLRLGLESWEWVYGKTPPFTVCIPRREEIKHNILLHIKKGCVSNIECAGSDHTVAGHYLSLLTQGLQGVKFTSDDIRQALDKLGESQISEPTWQSLLLDIQQALQLS